MVHRARRAEPWFCPACTTGEDVPKNEIGLPLVINVDGECTHRALAWLLKYDVDVHVGDRGTNAEALFKAMDLG